MINIAELLKDCPKGTKLYSPLFGEVELLCVEGNSIKTRISLAQEFTFSEHGKPFRYPNAECLLFPSKDYRTWQGWTPSVEPKFKAGDWITNGTCKVKITDIDNIHYWFSKNCILGEIESIDKKYHLWSITDAKDGDVITNGKLIVIFNKLEEPAYKQHIIAYVGLDLCGRLQITEDTWLLGVDKAMPATKEQRDLLFNKMREYGCEWDVNEKKLKSSIKPKFKVGDNIKTGNTIETIAEISNILHSYYCESGRTISFYNQDLWQLVPKSHYDISNFYTGMPVLVRADNVCRWDYSVFSRITGNEDWPFAVCNGVSFTQCIPFEGNEHLLGTTDMPSEEFINW